MRLIGESLLLVKTISKDAVVIVPNSKKGCELMANSPQSLPTKI